MPTVEAAHQVAKLCGVKSYVIADPEDTFGRKPIFETEDIRKWKTQSEKESIDFTASQHAKAERMGQIPKKAVLRQYGNIKLEARMIGTPVFRPGYSSKISGWYVRLFFVKNGTEREFHIENHFTKYDTKYGTFKKKDFMEWWQSFLGLSVTLEVAKDIKNIASDYRQFQNIFANANPYRIRRRK